MSGTTELMTQLADSAKQASEHVHAAASTTKEQLQSEVAAARASAEQMIQKLEKEDADARDDELKHWTETRQSWSAHIAEIRRKADADKAKHDVKRAQHRADRAEGDALAAVAFAMLAVEEAEYEVLDAILSRAEADEMAAAKV